MKRKNIFKTLFAIFLLVSIVSIISIVVLAASSQNKADNPKADSSKAVSSNELSQAEIIKLYKQGYNLEDIRKAEWLSGLCNKKVEDILKAKGKHEYKWQKSKDFVAPDDFKGKTNEKAFKDTPKVQDYTKEYNVTEVSKPWEDTLKEMGVDIKKVADKSGIPADVIKKMEKSGLTVESLTDYITASKLAPKYNMTEESILQMKKEKQDWSIVYNELEGGKK